MAKGSPVGWVLPPEPIGGLDHLGVQAPCTALFAQLLPGITNVTDRARYYSFHPWVLWSFEKRYKDHSLDEFRRVLRRAECLFALIAIRHSRLLNDPDEGRHGRAMVGRDALLKIEDSAAIVLDQHAAFEGPTRYFKNKLGGLGQYYFGPLRDLRVLDRSPQGANFPPGYDRDRGRHLAEAMAHGLPGDAFFEALEAPTLKWEDLDELAAFCPCALRSNPREHELLLDLFLARSEAFKGEGGLTRRASLGLILELAGREARHQDYAFEGLFRGISYSGALPDGSTWVVPEAFQRVQRGWATYQRNELLSIAVQGLFAAVLRVAERERGGRLLHATDGADLAISLTSSLGPKLALPLSRYIEEARIDLPALSDWLHPQHELQRGWTVQALGLDDEDLEMLAVESIAILVALLARGGEDYPYADFELDPDYFDPHEVHLLSLRSAARSAWMNLSVEEWIRWLAVHWGIGLHLNVALRKLRGEQRDTFRIRPLENELQVIEAPPPTFTIPRISSSVQILRDLGLINLGEEKAISLTDRGQRELEACRA